jgi:DNA modification methylase
MIHQGDCLQVLQSQFADESVQCCVTSPPYWGLRQYLFDKATVIRYDLTEEELTYVRSELEKRGIKPRQ